LNTLKRNLRSYCKGESVEELNKIIKFYGESFNKEEMFLVGFLMGCGGEMGLWNEIEHDMVLIEDSPKFWLPIIKNSLRIRKEVFYTRLYGIKELLRKKLEDRGAEIPKWLED